MVVSAVATGPGVARLRCTFAGSTVGSGASSASWLLRSFAIDRSRAPTAPSPMHDDQPPNPVGRASTARAPHQAGSCVLHSSTTTPWRPAGSAPWPTTSRRPLTPSPTSLSSAPLAVSSRPHLTTPHRPHPSAHPECWPAPRPRAGDGRRARLAGVADRDPHLPAPRHRERYASERPRRARHKTLGRTNRAARRAAPARRLLLPRPDARRRRGPGPARGGGAQDRRPRERHPGRPDVRLHPLAHV